jgi:hypothetical protein
MRIAYDPGAGERQTEAEVAEAYDRTRAFAQLGLEHFLKAPTPRSSADNTDIENEVQDEMRLDDPGQEAHA